MGGVREIRPLSRLLETFDKEFRRTLVIPFLGRMIHVLSLARISKSKRAIGRDKDKLHLLQIAEFLRCKRAIGRKRSQVYGKASG